MQQLNLTETAAALQLTKARISQLVSDGRLAGCYQGEGRARRFDLPKVAEALGRRLDPGQRLGNGAKTQTAVKAIQASNPDAVRPAEPKPDSKPAPAETAPTEYELARTRTALATAREAELRIAVKEGTYVLASAVANEVAGQMAQEIATIESQVLRAGARAIADENGLDFRAVHATLKATWRAYREKRRDAKSAEAEAAEMSDEEQERDV